MMSRIAESSEPGGPVAPGRDLTDAEYWDNAWSGNIRLRLPSPLVAAVGDLQRLLRSYVKPGDRVLEVGCAPGKILAWLAAALRANVSGLDFSARGLDQAARLFAALRLQGDLRREDLRATSFPRETFDLVYSLGVIEHFDDPRGIVRDHLSLVRPGGTALMTVPNYRGVYGTLKRYFDAESLLYHNLEIMTPQALAALAPVDERVRARAYAFGRLSPWVLTMTKRWPRRVALAVSYVVNAAALLQPVDIRVLCPVLVLEIVKPQRS